MEHKYFRNPVTGGVHAYLADGSEDDFILDGLVLMTPEQVAEHLSPPLTVDDYKVAIQVHMDTAARAAGYDDLGSVVTYADEPAVPKFQAEGQAFRAWRSLCWAYCYQEMEKVLAGQRTQPKVAELLAELPSLELPA